MASRTVNDLIPTIKEHLKYMGFDNLDFYEGYREDGQYFLGMSHRLNRLNVLNNPYQEIIDVVEPIFDSFKNSPFIADLKASHQKEIDSLKEDIKRLEKLNMNLSEGLSNGAEYLELHADGVKVVKE